MKIGITHISKEISARYKNTDQINDLYGVDEVEFHDLSIGVRGGWCTQNTKCHKHVECYIIEIKKLSSDDHCVEPDESKPQHNQLLLMTLEFMASGQRLQLGTDFYYSMTVNRQTE